MKPIRFVLAAIAFGLATSAMAVPTTGTYTFATPTTTTGRTTWLNTSAGYNATNGTDYGNTQTFASSGIANPVTVSAWASTGGVGGYTGTLESGYVSHYTSQGSSIANNEIAITSQPGTGNTAELSYSGATASPNTSNNEHAIDNSGSYESMLFSFASAVTLNTVNVGFPTSGSPDSDATVLVYNGTDNPTAGLSTRTYAQLLTSGWSIAGNLSNLGVTGSGTLTGVTTSSKYWMVGAYMAIGTNSNAMLADGKDYFKIDGLTVTQGSTGTRAVPEPGSLALFGIASVALFAGRRRSKRQS